MTPDWQADLARVFEVDHALCTPSGAFPAPQIDAREAGIAVGVLRALSAESWWAPSLRQRAASVLRGVSVELLRDPAFVSHEARVLGPSLALADRAVMAVGLVRAQPRLPGAVHLGPGALADGAFHEALQWAALWRLPVIFVLSQPDLSGAPITVPAIDLSAFAKASGTAFLKADSSEPEVVFQTVQRAIEHQGPVCLAVQG